MSDGEPLDVEFEEGDARRLEAAICAAFPSFDELNRALARNLGHRLNDIVGPNDNAEVSAFKVVEWASAKGWLWPLYTKLLVEKPDSDGLNQVFSERVSSWAFKPAAVRELRDLLDRAGYQDSVLWQLAHRVPQFEKQELNRNWGRRTIDLLLCLLDMHGRPEPPLLLFLKQLFAMEKDPKKLELLNGWLAQWAPDHRVETATAADVWPRLESADSGPLFLLIKIEERQDRYEVHAWLMRDTTTLETLQTEIPPELGKIEPELDKWLNFDLHQYLLAARNQLIIEFILPRSLIDKPVERLTFDQGGERVELGALYPVVVRPLWRLVKRDTVWPLWRQKWDALASGAKTLFCCHAEEHAAAGFIYQLREKKVFCLALTFAPRYVDAQSPAQDVLYRCVAAGAPAVLWVRDTLSIQSNLRQRLRPLVSSLAKLPETVFRKRERAARSKQREQELGAHLTLLWDDADRTPPIPPAAPLQPPSTTGVP